MEARQYRKESTAVFVKKDGYAPLGKLQRKVAGSTTLNRLDIPRGSRHVQAVQCSRASLEARG